MIPFLHLGPLTIPTYGLSVALGMVAAYFLLRADLARRGLSSQPGADAELFIAIPCLAGIIGSKIYAALETPQEFLAHPWQLLLSQYGFTWFGGMIAGAATFAWLAHRKKIPLLEMLDAGSPAATVGYAFGRLGCLLSGDGDYGIPTSLPWGMSFPNGLVPTSERVHPTPIYEMIVAVAIAWWLWRMGARALAQATPRAAASGASGKSKAAARRAAEASAKIGVAHSGEIFAAYLVLTGVARYLVEIIRINPRVFLGLTNAQIVSVFSVAAGAALWWRARRK